MSWLDNVLGFLFGPPSVSRSKTAQWLVVAFLFLMGATFWFTFFKCKESEPFFHAIDWKVEEQYYRIIQQAYQTQQVPYHVSAPVQPLRPTQRFMAVPESLYWLAPQAPLLAFISLKHFVIINVLLHFTVGFLGCLLLRRRFDLSPLAFLVLVLLFNLNGHIISHVAAGHKWNGYFYLSWFVVFVLDALDRRDPIFITAGKLALVNLFVLLQGTLHLYVLCLMFLGLLFVFSNRARWVALWAGILTVLLSLFRLAPAAMTLDRLKPTDFANGYASFQGLLNRLDSISLYSGSPFPWEYDIYIGLLGVIFLGFFGVLLAFSSRQELLSVRFKGIYLPLLVVLVLSLGDFFYRLISLLPGAVPNTERIPSRFMVLPLVFLVALSVIRFQRLHNFFTRIRWLGLCLVLLVSTMLLQLRYHWTLWRMASVERNFPSLADGLPMPDIIKMADPQYVHAVHITLAISGFALLLVAAALLWNWKRRGLEVAAARETPRISHDEITVDDRGRIQRWMLALIVVLFGVILAVEWQRWRGPDGLWVTYYEDRHLKVPAWRGVEQNLVRSFQDDPPVPWILPGGFSSRWTGYLVVPRDADYIFFCQSCDGIRFYLDERCLVDNWRNQSFLESGRATNVYLRAGLHPLKVEHYARNESGGLRIRWCGGGIPADTLLAAPYLRKRP